MIAKQQRNELMAIVVAQPVVTGNLNFRKTAML